jgi:dihydrofolate reductase
MKIVVINHLTLDGVMQAPGRADEDTRGGFAHGGWAIPRNDAAMGQRMAEVMGSSGALLLGRWTYESFFAHWPKQTNSPYSEALDNMTKYVASTMLRAPLAWKNSTLLAGDAPREVARLKAQSGGAVTVMGSGRLVQSLMSHDLVDEYLLLIHPVVLGSGQRLFPDGGVPATLRLVEAKTTTTEVIMATYQAGRS